MGLPGRKEEDEIEKYSTANDYRSIDTSTNEIRTYEENTVKTVLGRIVINGASFGGDIYDVEPTTDVGYAISFNSNDFKKAADAVNYDIESLKELIIQIELKIEQNKNLIVEKENAINNIVVPVAYDEYSAAEAARISASIEALKNDVESLRQDNITLENDIKNLEKEIEDKTKVLDAIDKTIRTYENAFGVINGLFDNTTDDHRQFTKDGSWEKNGSIFVVADAITGATHLCITITDHKHNEQFTVGLDESFDLSTSKRKSTHYKSFKEVFGEDAVKEVIYPTPKDYKTPYYDKNTKTQYKEYFDENGNTVSRLIRKFDDNGDIISTTVYETNNPLAQNSVTYNGQNQVTNTTTYICGNETDSLGNVKPIQETKISYNPETGVKTKEEVYDLVHRDMGRVYLKKYVNDTSGRVISIEKYTGQNNHEVLEYTENYEYNNDGTYSITKLNGNNQKLTYTTCAADGRVLTTSQYGD